MFGRLFFILLAGTFPLSAQESATGPIISCPGHSLYASGEQAYAKLRLNARPSAKFIPTYYQVPDSVRVVVETAFGIWDKILISPIPIHIDVHWEALNTGTLASAGSDRVFKNFNNAPFRDVWYPSALADALSGKSVNDTRPDIVLRINRDAAWNLDYSGMHNYRYYDMLSVIIHEIAHGIGFMSSFEASGDARLKWGIQNNPFIYDYFMIDEAGNNLVNNRFYTNDSEDLLKEVTEKPIYFQIDRGGYSEHKPRLHTENPFSSGASLSHLSSRQTLTEGDRLMLPSLSLGARYHYPGDGVLAILFQMGWALNFYEFEREYEYPAEVFSVFPNPTAGYVMLKINDYTTDRKMQYHLLDATGRVLTTHAIQAEETEISVQHLPPGRYFLRVGTKSLPVVRR